MFYKDFIQEKYVPAFLNIAQSTQLPSMEYVGHMAEQGWLKSNWTEMFNKIAPFYVDTAENLSHILTAELPDRSIVAEGAL